MTSARHTNDFPNVELVKHLMKAAHIPGVSIAAVERGGAITTIGLGSTADLSSPVTSETIFGAASLSKLVFAYLVMLLFNSETFSLDTELNKILPWKQFCDENKDKFLWKETKKDLEQIALLSPRRILSHTTGLSLTFKDNLDTESEYGYSGIPIYYLQNVIEKMYAKKLEKLAEELVFTPLQMNHSRFKAPAVAANSLQTTAQDYAKFMNAWISNEKLHYAFIPVVDMTKDKWARDKKISEEDLKKVAAGLGWVLQLNAEGRAIRAFHWGDMDPWRAFVAINLENKSGIVYFANSPNGHLLAEAIISPNDELKNGLNYFFNKLGFARNLEELDRSANSHGLKVKNIFEKKTENSSTLLVVKKMESGPETTLKKAEEQLETPEERQLYNQDVITDQDMAESEFGRSSHTAKKLRN